MFFTDSASGVINAVLGWIDSFGWYYFLAVVAYLVFVIAIGISRFGKIKLGPDHSTPDFNMASRAAALRRASASTCCSSASRSRYRSSRGKDGSTVEAARHAMQLTFLHWGLSGWGIYTLVGMSLAFFSYRHNLP